MWALAIVSVMLLGLAVASLALSSDARPTTVRVASRRHDYQRDRRGRYVR